MNWALDIATVVQLLGVVVLVGVGWQRLDTVERDMVRLDTEVRDFRELKADIKVIETRLLSVDEKLQLLLGHIPYSKDQSS